MDVTKEVEATAEDLKKHWWVVALFLFIYTAWLLSSDLKKSGSISQKASKWPIIGPYFFKTTPLATPTN